MTNKQLANPAPLGLTAFGMTTILLNIHNAGFYPVSSMILAMGLFFGGFAQIIAGILEFQKGNTFGLTAFTAYGSFWLTLVFLLIMPQLGWADPTPEGYMASYLFLWGVFTLFMFLGTLKKSKGLQCVFFSLTILFFLLTARDALGSTAIGTIAGWEGIFCGASALYVGMAEVLHEQYGKKVLPY